MIQERIAEIKRMLEQYEETMKVLDRLRDELEMLEGQQEKERLAALPFEQKFKEWFGSGKIVDNLDILEKSAPNFYAKYVEGRSFYRQAYKVAEEFGEDFRVILDDGIWNRFNYSFKTLELFKQEYAKIAECARELMENDIAGWVHEWG